MRTNPDMNAGLPDVICGFKLIKTTELPEVGGVFYEMEHIASGAKLGWLKNGDDNKTFSIAFRTTPRDDTGVFHILEHCVLQGSEAYPAKAPFVHLLKNSMATFLNAMTFPDKTVFPVSSRSSRDFENLMSVYMDAVLHPLIHVNENIFLQEGWHYEPGDDSCSGDSDFTESSDGEPGCSDSTDSGSDKTATDITAPAGGKSDNTTDSESGCLKPDNRDFYCSGVVLNEMKGDHSSVDSLIAGHAAGELFPDTCYRYDSGGDPKSIVTLDYDTFRKTHREFYHPSNAIILLDGDMDIERILGILNDRFLSSYTREPKNFPIPLQKPVCSRSSYTFAAEDADDMTGYLALGYVIGTYEDRKRICAAGILADYLADSNASPLKKTLLERGLCRDVSVYVEGDMQQPFVLFTIRNADPENREEIEAAAAEVLAELKTNGLDRGQLDALLCQAEFSARERDFGGDPGGVMNGIQILQTWLYGGDPVQQFQTREMFEELRAEIRSGGFERYLDEIFCSNPHRTSILMKPSLTLLEEEQNAEDERLRAIFAECTDEECEHIRAKAAQLKEWQAAPDSDEILSCIPMLTPDDISPEPMHIDTRIADDGTLWHSVPSRGISYFRLYFPIDSRIDYLHAASSAPASGQHAQEAAIASGQHARGAAVQTGSEQTGFMPGTAMSSISFLAGLYGELPLHHMDKASLDQEKGRLFGDFQVDVEVLPSMTGEKPVCCLCAEMSCLHEKESEALSLMTEIMTDTDFSAAEEIVQILYQQYESCQQSMIMDGHRMAMLKARAAVSETGRLSDAAEGPSFADWISSQIEKIEACESIGTEDAPGGYEPDADAPECDSSDAGAFADCVPTETALMHQQNKCCSLAKQIIIPGNMLVSVSSDGQMQAYTEKIKSLFTEAHKSGADDDAADDAGRESICCAADSSAEQNTSETVFLPVPAPVAYSAMAGNLQPFGIKSSGAWKVLAKLVSMDFLWNEIRVRGGAYGTGMSVSADGVVGYFSYRDPSPEDSLNIYRNVPEFIRQFCTGNPDLTGIKIGTVADTEPVLAPGARGKAADQWYLAGITDAYRKEQRRQILHADTQEMLQIADELQRMEASMQACIIASPEIMPDGN